MTTITDRRMPRGRAISVLSLAVWWAKLEKNDKVRHIVTQIASLLAVATVFIDLWTPFYSQGGLIRETKLPMQLKMQGGGLCARGGGVIAGFYGTYIHTYTCGMLCSELSQYTYCELLLYVLLSCVSKPI